MKRTAVRGNATAIDTEAVNGAAERKTKKAKTTAATSSGTSSSGGGGATTASALASIKTCEQALSKSKAQANQLLPLLEYAANAQRQHPVSVVIAATQSLRRVLLQYDTELAITRKPSNSAAAAAAAAAAAVTGDAATAGSSGSSSSASTSASSSESAASKFHSWLYGKYRESVTVCLRQLHDERDAGVVLSALHTLWDFARAEYSSGGADAANALVLQIALHTVANSAYNALLRDELLSKFVLLNDDLRWTFLKKLTDVFAIAPAEMARRTADSVDPAQIVRNILDLLLRIKINDASNKTFFAVASSSSSSAAAEAKWSLKGQKRVLNDAWLAFLKLPFTVDVYQSVLYHMHKHILPCVTTPITLADFLTDSYNVGGMVSLLALNGLFILITKYKLDYPNFYAKLYRLCTPQVFHAQYRERFFKLVSLFLTSNYLPAYLVGSFVKRFSRISLSAPPDGCVFICHLILNLLRRHPSCRVLIHRIPKVAAATAAKFASFQLFLPSTATAATNATDSATAGTAAVSTVPTAAPSADSKSAAKASVAAGEDDVTPEAGEDVYDDAQPDPLKSHAMQSSLWELKALHNHYIPAVCTAAKLVFAENAPKSDIPIDDDLELNYASLFEKELTWRKRQAMPMAFHKPDALFTPNELLATNFNLS